MPTVLESDYHDFLGMMSNTNCMTHMVMPVICIVTSTRTACILMLQHVLTSAGISMWGVILLIKTSFLAPCGLIAE